MQKILPLLFLTLGIFAVSPVKAQVNWPMAGANPERTSWTSTSLAGDIKTMWVKPITPYVSQHVQVIGAENKVFVSTADGLYAFDANTGQDLWKYPTQLPLGHSPTYDNGYLYVGGLDKKLHKVSASTGQGVWTFTADGGFSSSPIVTGGKVYATNRDGALYAINDTATPSLAWKFPTGNQIAQSPAFKNGILYFASNDGYAYAVNAATGGEVWKSDSDPTTSTKDKFPSLGFYAWWPVIYQNYVIFTRAGFYGTNGTEASWLFCPSSTPACAINQSWVPGTLGNVAGPWAIGEKTLDVSNITSPSGNPLARTYPDYFETFPYRRNAFFVDMATGVERQFDTDNDGASDAAPISWVGDGGSHDPPIVAQITDTNGVVKQGLYFHTVNRARGNSFSSATISAWNVGTSYLSMPFSGQRSSDEPTGLSAAGNKIYWNHCCDRSVGAIDISVPNNTYPNPNPTPRVWSYVSGGGLNFYTWAEANGTTGLPNNVNTYYFKEAVKFFWDPKVLPAEPTLPCCAAVFWNENDKVGPAAYNEKLYVILGNALVAIGPGGAGTTAPVLASAPSVSPPAGSSAVTDTQLKARLEQEVSEMVASPFKHYKPSFIHSGGVTSHHSRGFEDYLNDYWHNPADLHLVLIRALPYLSSTLQQQVKAYLQSEYAQFPIASYSHIGYTNGVARDPYPYPPAETLTRLFTIPNLGPQQGTQFTGWTFPPINAYALWKYAQTPGLCVAPGCTPASLLTQFETRLKAPITANRTTLTNDFLAAFPNVHNAYISGYIGYIELAKLAGQTPTLYGAYQSELDRLKALRVQNVKTFPDTQQNFGTCDNECYFESLITHYNFAYMTRELGDYLRTFVRSTNQDKDILAILQKYEDIAPYWMMAHNGETQGESAIQPYQQTHSLFQALAQVKNASRDELLKYLDNPIVPVGDLYYIDNLTAVLEATGGGPPTPTPVPGDQNGDYHVDYQDLLILISKMTSRITTIFDYNALVGNFGK